MIKVLTFALCSLTFFPILGEARVTNLEADNLAVFGLKNPITIALAENMSLIRRGRCTVSPANTTIHINILISNDMRRVFTMRFCEVSTKNHPNAAPYLPCFNNPDKYLDFGSSKMRLWASLVTLGEPAKRNLPPDLSNLTGLCPMFLMDALTETARDCA